MKLFTKFALIIVMYFVLSSLVFPQEDKDKKFFKENLNYFLQTNNSGTLFYISFIPCWEEEGPNNALRIYIHSLTTTKVTLEVPGLGISRTKTTIPNDVIEFTLQPSEGQCYSKGNGHLPIPPKPEQVWEGRAVIIKSDDPIICYGVTRYQYTSDGFLAYPVTTYGKNYTVASYVDPTNNSSQFLPSETAIVGVYNNTKVTFKMGGCESCKLMKLSGDTLGYGEIIRRVLNSGDVWLLSGIGAFNDLSGSKITATKPVSVYSGNFCAFIPSHVSACDFIDEQELPENIWGTKYRVTPMNGRKNFSIIKIFAKKAFTRIFSDGVPMWTITSPGGILGVGYIETRAGSENTPRPVVINSEPGFPINVVQYNPGQDDDNYPSDPFQMQCVPEEQYQTEIVFNTPGIRDGIRFKDNYINLVYKATSNGVIPDDIQFGEVENGNIKWSPLSLFSGNPGNPFTYDIPDENNRKYFSKTIKLPLDGVYRIKGKDPFACYAYGFGENDSYGFPTSSGLTDLETPDTLAPYIEHEKDCSGNITGKVIDEPRVDPENRSNLGNIYMDRTDSYNYTFYIEPYIVGEDATTTWTLLINDETLNAHAHLVFQDRAGNRIDTIFEHFALSPSILEYSRDFGTFKLESSPIEKFYEFTLTNKGEKPIESNLYKLYITLDSKHNDNKPNDIFGYRNFDLDGIENVDLTTLYKDEEIKFNVKFKASSPGKFEDSIGVIIIDKSTGDTCIYKYFTLIEAFVGNQYIIADDYDFKEQYVNTKSNIVTLQIENPQTSEYHSTANLKITGFEIKGDNVGVFGSGEVFEIDGFQNISESNPLIIAPGSNYPFKVSFHPNSVRAFNSEIKFTADANIPDNITLLKGKGIEFLPGLTVNSFDWGERLVDPNAYIKKGGNYDFTPYQSENRTITLYNDGVSIVTLGKPEIIKNVNGDAFIIEMDGALIPLSDINTLDSIFDGLKLNPNEEKTILVYFHPKTNGLHELELSFKSDVPNLKTSTLRGIGVYPKSETENLNFGDKIVGTGKLSGQVRFKNTAWADDYVLTITDLRTESEDNSSFSEFGSNGIFRWNRNNITDKLGNLTIFPIKLKPGDYVDIRGEYEPIKNGQFKGRLITVSDAEVEAVSTWTGSAIIEGWTVTPSQISTCQNLPKTLHPSITNNGSEKLIITKLSISNDNNLSNVNLNDFNIVINTPIIIEAGATQDIPILFTPGGTYNSEIIQLKVESNSLIKPKDETTLNITSTFNDFSSHVKLNVRDNKEKIAPGTTDAIKYTIVLDRDRNIADMTIPVFKVKVTYIMDFLGLAFYDNKRTNPKIELSNELISSGYTMMMPIERKVDLTTNTESITISLIGNSKSLFEKSGPIDLITVSFDAFLPYYKDSDGKLVIKNKKCDIKHEILIDDACLKVTGGSAEVYLDSVCADAIDLVKISSIKYGLEQVKPNPVNSEGGDIKFKIGSKDIYTEIKIYNSSSELVSNLFGSLLNSGEYSIRIPIEIMTNGVYFYEMKAGPYKQILKFVVQK